MVQHGLILFDWDGTLLNSFSEGFSAFNKSMLSFGISVDLKSYIQNYSPNWVKMYKSFGLHSNHWHTADIRWLQFYDMEKVKLMDGTKQTLSFLKTKSYILGLITSGEKPRILPELRKFSLIDAFETIVCGDDLNSRKPNPEGIYYAKAKVRGLYHGSEYYIGDSPDDIIMANSAGVVSIALENKLFSAVELMKYNPNIILNRITELCKMFN